MWIWILIIVFFHFVCLFVYCGQLTVIYFIFSFSKGSKVKSLESRQTQLRSEMCVCLIGQNFFIYHTIILNRICLENYYHCSVPLFFDRLQSCASPVVYTSIHPLKKKGMWHLVGQKKYSFLMFAIVRVFQMSYGDQVFFTHKSLKKKKKPHFQQEYIYTPGWLAYSEGSSQR